MSRKLGAEINLDYDNTQLAPVSRLAGANSDSDDAFSADVNTLVALTNKVETFDTGTETTFALTYPLNARNDFNPDAGVTVVVSLPAYDAAQCPLGQLFEVRNIGGDNSAVQIFDSDGNFIANTSIPPGAAFISRLIVVEGVLTLDVIRIGTIAGHDASEFAPSSTVVSATGRLSGGGALSTPPSINLNAYDIYQQVITDTTTARTLTPTDACALINFTNTGTATVTIDNDANQAIPNGAFIDLQCLGGTTALVNVTTSAAFNSGGGVLINNTNVSVGNNGTLRLKKLGVNIWIVDRIYEEYLHTTGWFGIWAGTESGNALLVRNGRQISFSLPVVTATATTALQITMDTAIPERFRQAVNTETRPLVVIDGGISGAGAGTLNTSGFLSVFATVDYKSFSGSGNSGFAAQNFTYTL